MSPMLREMLIEWRARCPRKDGKSERVFPNLRCRRTCPLPREGGGGALLYNYIRARIWGPAMCRLGLPPVTPHSARQTFISTLQAQGMEVGLVANLAGHKSAVVTLSHYTHAMRGGEEAVSALDRAFAAKAQKKPLNRWGSIRTDKPALPRGRAQTASAIQQCWIDGLIMLLSTETVTCFAVGQALNSPRMARQPHCRKSHRRRSMVICAISVG
jgi:hypothetical protein